MTPRYAAYGLAAIVGLLGILTIPESCGAGRADAAIQQANVDQGKAQAHEEASRKADEAVASLTKDLVEKQRDVDQLKAELADAKRRLAPKLPVPAPVLVPADPAIGAAVVDPRDEVLAKQDAVIQAQDGLIIGLKQQNAALVVARDSWKATAEDRAREAAGLRIALDAQKHAQEAAKWKHRVEGLVIGIGTGFLSGRMIR